MMITAPRPKRANFMRQASSHSKQQQGYMLLEILVTVGILGVGLLGVAALQISALRTSQSSIERGEAAIRISEMSNRMRANPAGVTAGDYELSTNYIEDSCSDSSSGPLGRACDDIADWITEVKISHGSSAKIKIICSSESIDDITFKHCLIGMRWDDQRGDVQVNVANANDTQNLYSYETQVLF